MKKKSLWQRTAEEIAHWRRPDWSFADVGRHWDSTESYDDINEETYSYFRRFIDGLRLSDIPEGSRILDLCARTGNGTLYFFQQGKIGSAVCADVSPKMGAICRNRLSEGGFYNFVWVRIFDYPLPFASDEFDHILCFETVEHFSQPFQLISELGRVVKPGGAMILTTPNILWEPAHALAAITGLHHSEGPHRFIRRRRLLAMVKQAGFRVEQEQSTVLIPGGPAALTKMGEWLEQKTKTWLMPWLGLRRILICRKM